METKINGRKILEQLLDEVNMAEPDMFKPQHELHAGDTELGKIEDRFMRQLYNLAQLHRRDERLARAEAQFVDHEDDEAVNKVIQIITSNDEAADVLMAIFWYCVRNHFQHWCGGLGVRKGWIAVEPAPPKHPLIELLQGGE